MIRVEPLGVELDPEPGETIIEAAWRLGYHWPTTCHGQANCTVCHVEVLDGAEHLSEIEDDERSALENQLPRALRSDNVRLACRARATGDLTVLKKGVRPVVDLPTL